MVARTISLASFILVAIAGFQGTSLAQATNDWSQPCFSGTCSYDLLVTSNGPSGSIKIWGAQHAIGDITSAGGWEVVSCDPSSSAQDLKIVCQGPEGGSPCAHLFNGPSSGNSTSVMKMTFASSTTSSPSAATEASVSEPTASQDGKEQGAVGKIVCLPENCGKSAFARISKAWIPTNQTIPPSLARRLVRRDGEVPVVKAFTIDVNFSTSDARHGPVGFALIGANFPGAPAIGDLNILNIDISNSSSLEYVKWGFWNPFSSSNNFNFTDSTTLLPLNKNGSVNLFNQEIDCSANVPVAGLNSSIGVNGQLKVDVDANVNAVVGLGVTAIGTILPPKIEQFGIMSSITADIDGSIVVSAGVGGTIDSGKISVFELGVPGLSFHGILEIGPTLEVNAEASAMLDLDVDLEIGVSYHIENAQFVFPDGGNNGGTYTPGDTPLQITVQPSASATGTVAAHLIPTLKFGITALETINADVFVDLDASATTTLTIDASTVQDNALNPRFKGSSVDLGRLGYNAHPRIRGRSLIGERYFKSKHSPEPFGVGDVGSAASGEKNIVNLVKMTSRSAGITGGSAAKRDDNTTVGDASSTTSTLTETTATTSWGLSQVYSLATPSSTFESSLPSPSATSAGVTFGGCVEVDVGLNVNVGADADFFGLFNPSTTLPLFEASFTLFKDCFGNQSQVQQRRDSFIGFTKRDNGLKCNDPNVGKVSELVNEVIPSTSLT